MLSRITCTIVACEDSRAVTAPRTADAMCVTTASLLTPLHEVTAPCSAAGPRRPNARRVSAGSSKPRRRTLSVVPRSGIHVEMPRLPSGVVEQFDVIRTTMPIRATWRRPARQGAIASDRSHAQGHPANFRQRGMSRLEAPPVQEFTHGRADRGVRGTAGRSPDLPGRHGRQALLRLSGIPARWILNRAGRCAGWTGG